MTTAPPASRIAPTPSGYLHLGNALSFILTWLLVRKQGGVLHLRIDDLDAARRREAYIEDIFRTLDWLSLDYDEGPSGPDDFYHNHSQQHRIPSYEALLNQAREQGALFACTCSRKKIQLAAADGQYPGTCRDRSLPFDAPETAWRIRTPENAQATWHDAILGPQRISLHAAMRDFVVRRKDGIPAYQIASLSDDLAMGVNCIVRGADLLDATAAQLFLAHLLDCPAFAHMQWFHHPLLLDAQGQKLSKSQDAPALHALRAQEPSPQRVFQAAAQWLGLAPARNLPDLLAQFEGIPAHFR